VPRPTATVNGVHHLGDICRRAREARGATATQVARAGGVAPSTVLRLEAGAAIAELTLERYLAGLTASCPAQPLSSVQLDFLRRARGDARAAQERRAEYGLVHLDLLAGRPSRAAAAILRDLTRQPWPAWVADGLGFGHAANEQLLRMLGADADGGHLHRWHAWHMLGSAIAPGGAAACPGTSHESAVQWVSAAFHFMRRFLFIPQASALTARLALLSPAVFPGIWRAATSLLLPYDPSALGPMLTVDDNAAIMEAACVQRAEIDLGSDRSTRLTLMVWRPVNEHARRVLEKAAPRGGSQRVVLAREFDDHGDFHVNRWPEVVAP